LAWAVVARRICIAWHSRERGESGPISTPFHGKLRLSEKQLNEAASAIGDQVPLHRFGEARKIAKAALFLAGDGSTFMTASELVVDGGISRL
jgi:NAD(P)-dependent dehydrogenase (short-subunit alcohol dehydrogenase family)